MSGYVYRRVNGQNRCPVCGEYGHGRARHESESASAAGARLIRDEGLTFRAAAARVGVSHEAVRQAFRARFGTVATPTQKRWSNAKDRAVEIAKEGGTVMDIAAEVGLHGHTVKRALRERGVRAHDPRRISEDDISAAETAIANGASYQEVATDIGGSSGRIADILRARGVYSSATSNRRMDGRMARAVTRIEAGESVPDACRAERCASSSVYAHFKRLRKAT